MKNIYFYLSVFCLSFVLFSSCDNFEGKQEIPAYLKINKIELDPNSDSNPGHLTSDIRSVLVTAIDPKKNKEEVIGTFELPCEIPILLEGEIEIRIAPVVIQDLNTATQTVYPFFNRIIDTVTLKQGVTTTLDPVIYTKYNTAPAWEECFEELSTGFFSNDGSITISTINSPVKSGTKSGFIGFESSDTIDLYTLETFYVPNTQQTFGLYLEFDYWTTDILHVGMTGFNKAGNQIAVVNQLQIPTVKDGSSPKDTDKWRKVYVSLYSLWSSYFDMNENFKIGFWVCKNKNSSHPGVYIDNIKLFYAQ